MRFTADLLIEGSPTVDNRLIATGATRWGDGPWPLMWADDRETAGYAATSIVGLITSLALDGAVVVAEGDVFSTAPQRLFDLLAVNRSRLGADLSFESASKQDGDLFRIDVCTVRGATFTVSPAWPNLRFALAE